MSAGTRTSPKAGLVFLLALASAGCSGSGGRAPTSETMFNQVSARPDSIAILDASFETPRDTLDNVDSPAVWHGPAGEHWLLATAKETDVILVIDAETGDVLRRVGGEGRGPGQLDRPNGIAVLDDFMWVVERDNARVQIFSLPDFTPLGSFGSSDLRKPYGIALLREGEAGYRAYITDNYEFEEDLIPADSLLGERVRSYRISVDRSALSATLIATFGDTSGEGRLRVVESIAADSATGKLLIAEEEEGASMIKVYDLNGTFTGDIIDSSFFPNQAEGIVLYSCEDGGGHWIATDQGVGENTFHLFDRRTFEHHGSFRGRTILNTDGIALTQRGFGNFASGAFYAVHDDGSVAAIPWSEIAGALGIRADCTFRD